MKPRVLGPLADCVLEDQAENDLLEIGRYTTRTWGIDQAVSYLTASDHHFAEIVAHDVLDKSVFEHREDFRVSRCQHHFVFFVRKGNGNVLVLAVLHENMDLVSRFRERLESKLGS